MASFLKFINKPANELEKGGRDAMDFQADEGEPVKKCPNCRKEMPLSKLWANHNACECGYHFKMSTKQRLRYIVDEGSFDPLFADVFGNNPLDFPGYPAKLQTARDSSNDEEAVTCGVATIGGYKCCLFIMSSFFMMGSMGTAVGERITSLFEYATEHELPVLGYTVSGGARMQEGLFSLMQMAKTSAAVQRHNDAGLLYMVVLTNPTTGGVTASFAMEGDIIMAEPGATVGFAGKRVIEQTTHKALPKGFQTSEFLLEHGFVDAIVPRKEQRETIIQLLDLHGEAMQ